MPGRHSYCCGRYAAARINSNPFEGQLIVSVLHSRLCAAIEKQRRENALACREKVAALWLASELLAQRVNSLRSGGNAISTC